MSIEQDILKSIIEGEEIIATTTFQSMNFGDATRIFDSVKTSVIAHINGTITSTLISLQHATLRREQIADVGTLCDYELGRIGEPENLNKLRQSLRQLDPYDNLSCYDTMAEKLDVIKGWQQQEDEVKKSIKVILDDQTVKYFKLAAQEFINAGQKKLDDTREKAKKQGDNQEKLQARLAKQEPEFNIMKVALEDLGRTLTDAIRVEIELLKTNARNVFGPDFLSL